MRVQNAKVKITIPIPVNKPDGNGVIFTKDAIKDAINSFPLPIIYKDNDKCIDGIVIGATVGVPTVEWNEESQTCNMTIDGIMFHSGAGIMVNEVENEKITDFDFTCIGFTSQ